MIVLHKYLILIVLNYKFNITVCLILCSYIDTVRFKSRIKKSELIKGTIKGGVI